VETRGSNLLVDFFLSVVANRAFFSSDAGKAHLYIDGTKRAQDVHGWRYIIV
jgi:hypothetical protein